MSLYNPIIPPVAKVIRHRITYRDECEAWKRNGCFYLASGGRQFLWNVNTASETTRGHNQKSCIVSVKETVTTQERRWKIGIFACIAWKMSVKISQIRNRNFYCRNRNVYVTVITFGRSTIGQKSLFRLLLACKTSFGAYSLAAKFPRLSLLCLSPSKSDKTPTTITQLFITDINLLHCHHTSLPASPSLTAIT